ncbi:MAG: polyhydroxyalkanoate synthesis regulator DNA-binding domain-containing protein [Planctomycetota bacterium]|nr:polyhydroxyalkanoate synthesis regulator DNA-binding domain-containing protein [Planctomycetota bacterium]
MRTIRRYTNRKLYDLSEKRYVTLREIARFVRAGQEVTVEDNETGEDITSLTLCQVIYEETRLRRALFPSRLLHRLLARPGSEIAGTLRRFLPSRKLSRAIKNVTSKLTLELIEKGTISPGDRVQVETQLRRRAHAARQKARLHFEQELIDRLEEIEIRPDERPDAVGHRIEQSILQEETE